MLAHDALVCRSCGNLLSVCSDPDVDWHPQTSVCWATASEQWGVRRLKAKHKDSEPSDDALHPLDGVGVWASQVEPEDDEFA